MTAPLENAFGDVHNKDIAAIWLQVYSCLRDTEIGKGLLVCKTFGKILPPLIKDITLSSPVLDQAFVESLALRFPNLKNFTVYQEYNDNNPVVDWSQVVMPHLQHLDLNYCPLNSIKFSTTNTPNLKLLGLEHAGQDVCKFDLALPHLENLSFRFTTVADGCNFGKSVSACPNLKSFSAYKLWGLGDAKQKLNLPNCTTFALDRPDDLYHLELVAPKLTELELLDCHGLEHVRLLPKQGSPVKVSLMGTTLDEGSLHHLHKHPRVRSSRISYEDPMIDEYIAMKMDDPFLTKDENELQKLKDIWRQQFQLSLVVASHVLNCSKLTGRSQLSSSMAAC